MSNSPAKSRSQFSLNLVSLIQIILFIIVIVAANFLSCQRYSRKDLTETTSYSLSDQTFKVLKNDLLTSRSEPVRIILAYSRSHPFHSRLKTVLEEYRRSAGGKIEIEIIDPGRSSDRAEELANQYRIEFTQAGLIIVDGRSGDEAVFNEVPVAQPEGIDALGAEANDKTQLQLSSHVRFLQPEDLALFSVNSATGRDLDAWQDEDAITSAILSSIEGKVRKIYYLADKSDQKTASGASPWETIAKSLYYQNVALTPVNIADLTNIPADADGVAIIAPESDLDAREMDILKTYWAQPRSSLFIMFSAGARPDNLRTFLRDYGVTPRNDRVLTVTDNKTVSTVRGTFTEGPEVNSALAGRSTSFEGRSSSLDIRENASDLVNRRISAIPLIQATDQFWGESDFESPEPNFDPSSDTAAPAYLAAAIIQGNANDDALADDISKMVVMSTTDFLDPQKVRDENLDFINASANWLLGREQLIGIAPKKINIRRMTFLSTEISFITRITLFFMPAIALIIAAFVWNIRRR